MGLILGIGKRKECCMVGLPSIGPLELILVLAIVFVIFGVGRLPEVGGAIGRALREFRREAAKTEEGLARLKGKQEEKPREEKKEPGGPASGPSCLPIPPGPGLPRSGMALPASLSSIYL